MLDLSRLIALYRSGQFGEAVALGEKIPSADRSGASLYFLGAAYLNLGRLEQARACFAQALQSEPENPEALMGLGLALRRLGLADEAIGYLTRAAHARPGDAIAQLNLGAAIEALGRFEEARSCFLRAIEIDPAFAEGHYYLGAVQLRLGDKRAAAAALQRAIELRPNYAEAHNMLANTLHELGFLESAAQSYAAALSLNPSFADAHYGLGVTLKDLGRREDSIAALTRALDLNPTHELARAQRLYQQAHICDWAAMEKEAFHLSRLGLRDPVSPFSLLAIDGDPERQHQRAACYAEKSVTRPTLPQNIVEPSSRIRVGYFSADFRNHAMMHVMAQMFELHDRSRFELHGFAFGHDSPDPLRERVSAAFDQFHKVAGIDDRGVAELARSNGIDIAVDLMGYTSGSRSAIFAYRAAPVQISYLGYPGTMGASFMEYLIADRVLIPQSERRHYHESIIYMPHSYQVSDTTRPVATAPDRRDVGLPDKGFVFCCFNNTYKIGRAEFEIWMRLLKAVDGSVLWLVGANRSAEANLRREAQDRGVNSSRLIFAPRVPPSDHLARQQAADLFLDTFNYNAHGTANDALWAGLPLITKPGRSFPSRVGASVLTGAGIPDLIAEDAAAYERLALELSTQPQRLALIKQRLAKNRASAPLFNTALFTKHLEAAYEALHERRLARRPAEDLVVEAIGLA